MPLSHSRWHNWSQSASRSRPGSSKDNGPHFNVPGLVIVSKHIAQDDMNWVRAEDPAPPRVVGRCVGLFGV